MVMMTGARCHGCDGGGIPPTPTPVIYYHCRVSVAKSDHSILYYCHQI